MNITQSSIRCSLQVALLGAVTSNLRGVNVVWNEKLFHLYFYYEQPPSEEEIEISEVVVSEVLSDFINISVHISREVLPTSIKIPQLGIRVFHRCEEISFLSNG